MATRKLSRDGIKSYDNARSALPSFGRVQFADQRRETARRGRLHMPNRWSRKQRLSAHCRDISAADSSSSSRHGTCDSSQGQHRDAGVQSLGQSSAEYILGEEGNKAHCVCMPESHLKWFLFPQELAADSPQLAEGPSLTLDHVERTSSGIYRCIADNGVREPVSIDMQLSVLCKFRSRERCGRSFDRQGRFVSKVQ